MFGQNNDTQTTNTNLDQAGTAPVMPANPFTNNDTPVSPPAEAAAPVSTPAADPLPAADPATTPAGNDDLLDLKQQALQNLQPLVSHLDQSPEEKFKTTMMLIQATDNPSLVKQAYEAANLIPDQKARAQALLDVVNEINYFTHKDSDSTDSKS